MNTEHTKHPCEAVEANADVMKLAEMILSDCGCSTSISDRLQRRVAGRIQLHVDGLLGGQKTEPVEQGLYTILYRDNWDGGGDTSYLLARLEPNGEWYAEESGAQLMTYEGDAILRAWPITEDTAMRPDPKPVLNCWCCSTLVTFKQRADADGNCPHCGAELDMDKDLVAQQQAEPVAWVRFCSDGCYEGPLMNSSPAMDGARRTSGAWTPLYATQPPAVAVAVPDGVARAIEAVAAAIYFADSSDYLSTLWDTLCFLSPEIAAIAESDARAAWERAEQDRAMLAAAQQGAAEGCGACGDGCQGQGCRLERESPPICQTCNGKGMIGGLLPNGGGYDGQPCPDCNMPQATAEDSSVVQDAVAVPDDWRDAAHAAVIGLGAVRTSIERGETDKALARVNEVRAMLAAAQKGGEA